MTVTTFIADLRARGVRLTPDGEKLRCRPKSSLTEDDLAALRTNKLEVLRLLRKEQRPVAARIVCYACKRSRFWKSIYGVIVCGRCHPPAHDRLVSEWIDAREESSRR